MKAFPTVSGQTGMDLRDYFAAKVMPAIVVTLKGAEIGVDAGAITEDTHRAARCAYAIADAMLEARNESL